MVNFDLDAASDAARLRGISRAFGLSLGDRAYLALAKSRSLPALTTDKRWTSLKGVEVKVIKQSGVGGNLMRVGVDVGGSLTKVAIEDDGARQYRLLEYTDPDKVAALIPQTAHVYATGCGARELAARLQSPVKVLDELECFCAGARHLVQEQGLSTVPFVLASLGTGTSIFHVTQESGTRVTGTGVGGGTITGLGHLLLSTGDFAEILSLAARGKRQKVDLMVSDLYRDVGHSPVLSALTAANFGRGGLGGEKADVASAIVQLVVEVVAVLSIQVARTYKESTRVVAGSPSGHTHIQDRFLEIGRHLGYEFAFLRHGAFCGALGALLLGSRQD